MTPGPPNEEQQTAADAEVAQRLAQAEVVISGVVLSVARFGGQRPAFLSQHDPEWWQATIEVQTVEKGKVASKTMAVLFANSKDVAWYNSPKMKQGDHGVWLLGNRDPFGKPVPGLAVVHPLDCQPIAQLERLRALLKKGAQK